MDHHHSAGRVCGLRALTRPVARLEAAPSNFVMTDNSGLVVSVVIEST
jgi:hypothetical protein